ncbi:peptide-methionine (R)-S-oxide reductase MsrB, partial [Candidatus Gracilibacteria bacterium]|nr:peptide-methionine (R)-S-oxide reductase MsrB [Candidatus Gracilibacteria bacterium]
IFSSLLWWKWPQIRAYYNPSPIITNIQTQSGSNPLEYKRAYFAAGCFWCAESSFEKYPGVIDAVSGYAGGSEIDPTYEQVGRGETSHREAVEVIYDPQIIDYDDLLQIFWRTANPVDDGGQYVDRGPQYTSAIWYQNPEEQKIAESSKSELEKSARFGSGRLVTPILSYVSFYRAEDYHQNYYRLNPLHYKIYTSGSGRPEYQQKIWGEDYHYTTKKEKLVGTNLSGPTEAMKKLPTKEELKAILTPIQYAVTQEGATERPFENDYHDNKQAGIYVDIVSGVPLYSSLDKFDSGTGWPSFTRPINPANISFHEDNGFFSSRTEVRGALSGAHIGHVFDDGPRDKGGKRYCMNSAALRFVPVADLEREGYGEYKKIFDK